MSLKFYPKVSIIIPLKRINNYLRESLCHLSKLDYPDYEVLVMVDEKDEGELENFLKTKVISTGPLLPAEKRDLALEYAQGEILAFLDDDAYPEAHWLKKGVKHFARPQVAAVGGPAVTPESDNLFQKASGTIYSSWLGSGGFTYRYLPQKLQEVDDFPSVNLLVRKEILEELGGFNTLYWPGEDTKLCLDITKKLNKKIIYDPQVLVWHHRRPLFKSHLKQVWNYGKHRGHFVRKLPETSLRLGYFVPTIFVLGLVFGLVLILLVPKLKVYYLTLLLLYLSLVIISSLRTKNFLIFFLVVPGIILTHITYGIGFLRGLLTRELREVYKKARVEEKLERA